MEPRHPNHPGELSTDEMAAERQRSPYELEARASAIRILSEAGIPFMVGGAYAFGEHTGIYRDTKDLDLFLGKPHALKALDILRDHGWRTERTYEQWLYKAFKSECFVDLIFSSGNEVATVDDEWFKYARPGQAFGQRVLLTAPEEIIWSKAFVLERERYDGADVAHLLRACAPNMDWARLLHHFERYWEVLLSHLLLFRFTYPSDRSLIPDQVMKTLLSKALQSIQEGDWADRICRGDLLSKVNYSVDIGEWEYRSGKAWDELERGGGPNGSGLERKG
jgi:hypothetical protein